MRSYPIDIAAFLASVRGVSSIDPVVDFDTGEHKRDRDGVPRWKLEVLIREPGARRSEVEQIAFTSPEAPNIDPSGELIITGLVGRPWSNQNTYGHASGFALSAETVGFKPTRRSTNGHPDQASAHAPAA